MASEPKLPSHVLTAGISYAYLSPRVGLVHVPFNGIVTVDDAVAVTEHLRRFLTERERHFSVVDAGTYDERRIRELHGVDNGNPYCAVRVAPAFIATTEAGLILSMDIQVTGPYFPRESPNLNNALLKAYAETLGWRE